MTVDRPGRANEFECFPLVVRGEWISGFLAR